MVEDTTTDSKIERHPGTAPRRPPLSYQSGFGNEFQSEAVAGALPVGRNSPQRAPLGLYAEQISGTAFTAPRHENRRTWTYRIWPSVVHRPYRRIDNGMLRTGPFGETEATPSQLRWSPFPIPDAPTDFLDGIITIGGNGSAAEQSGMAVHIYAANASMTERYFYNADGEMLDRPAAGPRPLRHRARHPGRRIAARSPLSRAACDCGSSCRTARHAAIFARITGNRSDCPSSGLSGLTDWPMRATFWRPSRPSRIAKAHA